MVFENKKITFIFAHIDDETILSYGTMLKFMHQHNQIYVLTLCGNGGNFHSGQHQRIDVFKDICKDFNIKLCSGYDIQLSRQFVKKEIEQWIATVQPEAVFTHSVSDMHFEHRLVGEEVLTACRRVGNVSVKALYATVAPTQMTAYNQFGSFQPNYFVDIHEFIEQKKAALERYSMELPSCCNDIRSAESIIVQNRQYGRLMGVDYCEAYQQLFKLD